MNSTNRLWLAAACIVFFFTGGVFLASRSPQVPVKQPTASATSLQDPDFSAPHKVSVQDARKSPAPDDLPEVPGQEDTSEGPTGNSSISMWTLQDNTPLYVGQGLNQSVLARLPVSTQVFVLQEKEDWTQVQVVNGEVGWVKKNTLGSQASGQSSPGSPKQSTALAALQSYFQDLNSHNWTRAYDKLSADFKTALPYRTFSLGYSGLHQVYMRVVRVQNLGPQSQIYYLEILSEERPKTKGFKGEYTLVLENGQWRIAQADLTEVAPRSLAPFPAQSVPVKPAFADPTPDAPDEDLIAPEE